MRQGPNDRLGNLQGFIQDGALFQDFQHLRSRSVIPKVMVRGEELPYGTGTNWEEIERVFKVYPHLPLDQWWKKTRDVNFESGSVRIGWKADKIYLLAVMEDCSVVTSARADGERLWELGDTVKIFIKSPSVSEYYEFQVAPNGHVLQLRYPDATFISALRGANMEGLDNFIIHERIIVAHLQVADGKWSVLLEIPANILFIHQACLLGHACQMSVARYDYWADTYLPCLSSTSPHLRLDFHRQSDWGLVEFVRARPRFLCESGFDRFRTY